MVVELFYPRGLKDVIADLRAKDDLNAEALDALNYQVYVRLAIFPILALLFLSTDQKMIGWVVTSIIFFGLWFDIRCHYKNHIGAYIFGSSQEAKVTKLVSVRHFRKKIICQNIQGNQKVVIGPLRELWKSSECPHVDDSVYYFQDHERRFKLMLDLVSIKKKYCLSKSVLRRGKQ